MTVLGTVPGGLPTLGLPTDVMTSANVVALLPTVVSLVIVILAQSAATSRAYAMKYGDSFDENVDLVGLGMANIGAGITGTFVVNGSPTKTEMVDSGGGRSQVSQLTAGAVVALVLLFLTGPLAYMPNAVLAAVVFLIGLRLIDYRGMAAIGRVRQGEFAVAAVTAAVVVVVGVEQGIILAMALSIVEHIYHSYRPYDTLLAMTPDGTPGPAPLADRAEALPGPGGLPLRVRACTTRTARASPRRSWTSSRPPIRRSAGSRCRGPRWGTSTTPAPTRSGRSRRSSPARVSPSPSAT